MLARVLIVFAAVMVFISGALASSILPAEGAPSLQSEPDLEVTVEALQTQVAEQDARITTLEYMVGVMFIDRPRGGLDVRSPTPVLWEPGELDIRSPTPVLIGEVVIPTGGAYGGAGIGSWCVGEGEHSDLRGSASVTITNGLGVTIGSDTLGGGFVTEAGCAMGFIVPVTSKNWRSDRYEIQIADLPAEVYTFERLEELDWEISITVTP